MVISFVMYKKGLNARGEIKSDQRKRGLRSLRSLIGIQDRAKGKIKLYSLIKTKEIMSQFLLLFRGGDQEMEGFSPEEFQASMQLWMKWLGDLAEKGQMLGSEPLLPTGATVSGPQKLVTDGPYLEGKEMVGGYLICTANSLDEAKEIAKGCPILAFESGNVEIREIQKMDM